MLLGHPYEKKFKVNVPLEGGGEIQAGFSRDDFDWIKGEFNLDLAREAAKQVGRMVNDEGFWIAFVEKIAKVLRKGAFRNGL